MVHRVGVNSGARGPLASVYVLAARIYAVIVMDNAAGICCHVGTSRIKIIRGKIRGVGVRDCADK